MEKAKKNLKVYSILFLVLAIIQVVIFIAGELTGNVPSGAAFVMGAICSGVIVLAELIMGFKGIAYANGSGKGTLHITIAKIAVVFIALGLVIDIFGLVTKTGGVSELIISLIDLVFVFGYIKEAKAVAAE